MNSGCAAVSDAQQRTDRNMMEAVERIKPLQVLTTIGRFSVALMQGGALWRAQTVERATEVGPGGEGANGQSCVSRARSDVTAVDTALVVRRRRFACRYAWPTSRTHRCRKSHSLVVGPCVSRFVPVCGLEALFTSSNEASLHLITPTSAPHTATRGFADLVYLGKTRVLKTRMTHSIRTAVSHSGVR